MPLYSLRCSECETTVERFFHMNDTNGRRGAQCSQGHTMRQLISRINVRPDIQPYQDHTLGSIRSRRHHKDRMNEVGVHQFDPGEWRGEPNTLKRDRYNMYMTDLAKSKDIYKHKIKRGDEVHPNIVQNCKSKHLV